MSSEEAKAAPTSFEKRFEEFFDMFRGDCSGEADSIGSRSETTDGTAGQANVMPTAVRQIAEECAAAICDGHEIKAWRTISKHYATAISLTQTEVAERIAKTLDAIQQARQEGRSPTS